MLGQDGEDGAGLGGGVFNLNGNLEIVHSTFSDNSADDGGALYQLGVAVETTVELHFSVLANSVGGDDFASTRLLGATVNHLGGGNLIEKGREEWRSGAYSDDPELGPLADNGGPTRTHLPAATSSIVDTGPSSASLPADQRGYLPRIAGSGLDLGAVELGARLPTGLRIDDATAVEPTGSDAVMTFLLSRSHAEGTPSVRVTTVAGTAGADDFVVDSRIVTFEDGGSLVTEVGVVIRGDAIVEKDETFRVVLDQAAGNGVVADPEAFGTIEDDDVALLSISDASATESAARGSVLAGFTVTCDGEIAAPVTVTWGTVAGTAMPGDDFTASSGTLEFSGADGEALGVWIEIAGDTIPEPTETFFVDLLSVQAGGLDVQIADGRGVATIFDDDGPFEPPLFTDGFETGSTSAWGP